MRPFLHDVMTVLQSKGFIAIFVFFLLLPLTLIPDIAQANIPEFDLQPSIIIADHDTQGLNFLAYTTDKYGQPIPSTLYIDIGIPNVGSKHVVIFTNESGLGFSSIKIPGVAENTDFSMEITDSNGFGHSSNRNISYGVNVYISGTVVNPVYNPDNPNTFNLLFFYASGNLSMPKGYKIYYSIDSYPSQNHSNLIYLGTMSGFATLINPPPAILSLNDKNVTFSFFAPNGTLVFKTRPLSSGYFDISTEKTGLYDYVKITWIQMFSLTVPLVATYAAISSYGDARLSGRLDLVLARPVSKRGLLLSRYLAINATAISAITAGILLVDALIYLMTSSTLPTLFVLGTIVSAIVESLSFTGLTILLSHVIRTSNALIMFALILSVTLSLISTMVIFPLGFFGSGIDSVFSEQYLQSQVYSYLINPTQFASLVLLYLQGFVHVGGLNDLHLPISQFGVTLYTLIIDAAVWIFIPLTVALYLAGKRD
jgi:ABC-type transport system involved in multi-copper enzyme maturation permease subunit